MIPVAAAVGVGLKIEKALLAKMTYGDVAKLLGVTIAEVEAKANEIKAKRGTKAEAGDVGRGAECS